MIKVSRARGGPGTTVTFAQHDDAFSWVRRTRHSFPVTRPWFIVVDTTPGVPVVGTGVAAPATSAG
jgi:hypothetical protein